MRVTDMHFKKLNISLNISSFAIPKSITALLLGISLSVGGIASEQAIANNFENDLKGDLKNGFTTGLTDELVNDRTCEGTGGILAYAETKDYGLYVCADINNPNQPRHYRSVNKNGTPGVSLTARTYNPNQGNYFEFHNGDYVYMLQLPSTYIKQPVLVVEFPDGDGYEQKITRLLLSRELLQRLALNSGAKLKL